jgi:hypothetical protein
MLPQKKLRLRLMKLENLFESDSTIEELEKQKISSIISNVILAYNKFLKKESSKQKTNNPNEETKNIPSPELAKAVAETAIGFGIPGSRRNSDCDNENTV